MAPQARAQCGVETHRRPVSLHGLYPAALPPINVLKGSNASEDSKRHLESRLRNSLENSLNSVKRLSIRPRGHRNRGRGGCCSQSRGRAEGRALRTSLLRAATARAQGTAGGKASGGAVLIAPQQGRHQLTLPSPVARGNASSHTNLR